MAEERMDSALPKLFDNGNDNNYMEWETKASQTLSLWNLWKYIKGPESTPPVIPSLISPQVHHGEDEHGNITTIHTRGNKDVRDKAIKDAAPWTVGNTLCLVRIINAVPRQQIHQVKCAVYAKDAWNSLRSIYLP